MRRLLQSESGGKNLSAERRWIIRDHEKTLPKVLHYPQLFLRQCVNLLYMEVQDATFRYFNIPFSWSVGLSFVHPRKLLACSFSSRRALSLHHDGYRRYEACTDSRGNCTLRPGSTSGCPLCNSNGAHRPQRSTNTDQVGKHQQSVCRPKFFGRRSAVTSGRSSTSARLGPIARSALISM